HCLRSRAIRELEQARMQAMVQKQVSRKDAQHLREPHGAGGVCFQIPVLGLFSHPYESQPSMIDSENLLPSCLPELGHLNDECRFAQVDPQLDHRSLLSTSLA